MGDDFLGSGIIFRTFFGMSSGNSHGHPGVCHFAKEGMEDILSVLVPLVLARIRRGSSH